MLQVVWFKRDLRLFDHQPLVEAARSGEVLLMYVAEPSIWTHGDLSKRHLRFVNESLQQIDLALQKKGVPFFTAVAEIEDVLESIFSQYGPFRLLAHEENGATNTYARDRRVHRWMRERGLSFDEFQHFGVKRRLKNRDHFQRYWETFMNEAILPVPSTITPVSNPPRSVLVQGIDFRALLGIVPGQFVQQGQVGGEEQGERIFQDFLTNRSRMYQSHLSFPFESMRSCGRISPYLAWGNLSIRSVVHRTHEQIAQVDSRHRWHLQSFLSRLQWHCHFIQRIEDEPRLDSLTMNQAYEGIRSEDEQIMKAWLEGRTGFPIVDASMRCLQETGWLHFRGRAMVVSFICNTLMQDWRTPAKILSQLFLDYEPGIHYSQIQMQAGTTGFNTIRIYNPTKHSIEHDPEGKFIRRFVPELADIPLEHLHEPWWWQDPVSFDYVRPMVDLAEANRVARDALWNVRKLAESKEEAARLLEKHGSRRGSGRAFSSKRSSTNEGRTPGKTASGKSASGKSASGKTASTKNTASKKQLGAPEGFEQLRFDF